MCHPHEDSLLGWYRCCSVMRLNTDECFDCSGVSVTSTSRGGIRLARSYSGGSPSGGSPETTVPETLGSVTRKAEPWSILPQASIVPLCSRRSEERRVGKECGCMRE